jgi:hypothetical protein
MDTVRHSRAYTVRPRVISPEFATDPRVEDCSILAALLYDRLISQADDQGRLPGSVSQVKARCFPARNARPGDIGKALDELADGGLILRYQADGREFIQVFDWLSLQGRNRRAYPSRYPAPTGWTDWTRVPRSDDPEADGEVSAPGRQSADTLLTHVVPSRNGTEQNGTSRPGTPKATTWDDFTDPAWEPFRDAWQARFRFPPTEDQRAALWPVVDSRPNDAGVWVLNARQGAKAFEVVAHVLDRWRAFRTTQAGGAA